MQIYKHKTDALVYSKKKKKKFMFIMITSEVAVKILTFCQEEGCFSNDLVYNSATKLLNMCRRYSTESPVFTKVFCLFVFASFSVSMSFEPEKLLYRMLFPLQDLEKNGIVKSLINIFKKEQVHKMNKFSNEVT